MKLSNSRDDIGLSFDSCFVSLFSDLRCSSVFCWIDAFFFIELELLLRVELLVSDSFDLSEDRDERLLFGDSLSECACACVDIEELDEDEFGVVDKVDVEEDVVDLSLDDEKSSAFGLIESSLLS